MESDFSTQILSLREDHIRNPGVEIIRSRRCISCSKNNQLTICGYASVYIVDLNVPQDIKSEHRDLLFTTMYSTPLLLSLPEFSFTKGFLFTRESVLNITEEQRQILITDPALLTYPSTCNITLSTDYFNFAVMSPVSHNCKHRPLLATLTNNHRLIFYREIEQEWRLVYELSPLFVQIFCAGITFPLRLGKDMSFEDYVNMCYSLSTTEILWSPVYLPIKPDLVAFHLFFTGTKSGSVHVWKIRIDTETLEDVEFICTVPGDSEVTSLSFHLAGDDTGYLAVGQFDGNVRVHKVTCDNDHDLSVKVTEIFSLPEADGLSVTALDWIMMTDETLGVVVCKEFYILLYKFEESNLIFCQHQRLEGCLTVTAISTHGSRGTVATLDSQMYKFTTQIDKDKYSLKLEKMKPPSLPLITEVDYLSYGMCLSPHGAVCFSVHKPNRNFTKNTKRLVLETFKVTLSAPFAYSPDLIISSMATVRPTGFTDCQPSLQDILVLQKLHLRDIDYADEISEVVHSIYEKLSKSTNESVSHILWHLTLSTKQCFHQHEFQSEEWLETMSEATKNNILTRYVRECYSRLPQDPSPQDLTILASMRQWAEDCKLTDSVPEGLMIKLADRFPQISEIPEQTCQICGENFTFESKLILKCSNSHRMKACCLTFQPCQDGDARQCTTCNNIAVSRRHLSQSVLVQTPDSCSLCGCVLVNS